MALQSSGRNPTPRPSWWVRILGQHVAVIAFLGIGGLGMLYVYAAFTQLSGEHIQAVVATDETANDSAAAGVGGATVRQRLPQSPPPWRVGIISGHKDHDPGAVCADGLTEAEVNLDITQRVIAGLRAQDVSAELLAEFDDRLIGYDGALLVSIHADSCDYYGDDLTGFKIAASSAPTSAALSACLFQAYQRVTQLPFHPNTITPHMTDYHVFREILPSTPAVIIETGFLNQDRAILTSGAELPAQGIIEGIICFLEGTP